MEDRSISISINASTVVKVILIGIAAWLIYRVQWVALDMLTAIVIASAIEPAVASLQKRKIPRPVGVLMVYISLIIAFAVIFYIFLPLFFGDLVLFVASLPALVQWVDHTGWYQSYLQFVGVPIGSSLRVDSLLAGLQTFINTSLLGNAFTTIGNVFGGILSFILIFVFSIYFAVLETGMDDFLSIITPKNNQSYVIGLWRRSQYKIGLWMQGQLIMGLIMGILVFLGLTILGVPHALVLACTMMLFEIIPMFGPVLAAIPGVAIALSAGGLTLALLTTGMYLIFQQFESHLIAPLVVTRVIGIPPLLIILSVIVGGQLAGFLGVLLAVPFAATLQEYVRDRRAGRSE